MEKKEEAKRRSKNDKKKNKHKTKNKTGYDTKLKSIYNKIKKSNNRKPIYANYFSILLSINIHISSLYVYIVLSM